jgi:hypothetical protein
MLRIQGVTRMKAFRIAINMAGATSAGAYTAGVLDFLTEALDAWYLAKSAGKEVPGHDVSIEAFSVRQQAECVPPSLRSCFRTGLITSLSHLRRA